MYTVKLLDGMFKKSQQTGEDYLLSLDIDRFIAPCYEAHNLKPKKPRYEGWEARDISGHSLGHYLTALAYTYKSTGHEKLKDILNYAVDELANIQDITGSGYIGGLVETPFKAAFSGDFTVGGFDLHKYWVPWYSVHKIYQGLIDAYLILNNEKALSVVLKFADWAADGLDGMTDEQIQKMLLCEHGGMNEVFAELYGITNNKKYLTAAKRFTQKSILNPLEENKDELQGLHANTQIPKIIGAAQIYNVDNSQKQYKNAAEFFWDTVVNRRSYVFGGNSIGEHFEALGMESIGIKSAESCNTHNMMILTQMLYDWKHDSTYMDYYENALFNHILGTQDPCTGHKTYFTSTLQGHYRIYSTKDTAFWCCTGTGMENPGRYNEGIYYIDNDDVYVNLFISSELNIDNKFAIEQTTDFPYSDSVKLTVTKADTKKVVKIRVPKWVSGDIKIKVNGGDIKPVIDNGYIILDREWSEGDIIEYTMPMSLQMYTAKDTEHKVAFKYGPIVLAGKFGNDDFPNDTITDETKLNTKTAEVPNIITQDMDFRNWISVGDIKTLTFELSEKVTSNHKKVTLVPFYGIHHEYYNVYWFVNDESNNVINEINKVTIDSVQPDGQQDEIGHNMKRDEQYCRNGSFTDEKNNMHMWREAHGRKGTWFSYDLNVGKDQNYLCVEYWGSESSFMDGIMYTRELQIEVDNTVIAHQKIDRNNIGRVYYVFYEIPKNLTENKNSVTVKFSTVSDSTSASIIGVRITNKVLENVNK